jgi:hypothetical protein
MTAQAFRCPRTRGNFSDLLILLLAVGLLLVLTALRHWRRWRA